MSRMQKTRINHSRVKRLHGKKRYERFKNSIALILAIVLLSSVLPTALASMTGSDNDAAVESFGKYEDSVTIESGTSHDDAAARLPDKLPAVVTEQAESYWDDVSVKWTSETSYYANKPGKYEFIAEAAGGLVDKAWPVYTVEILAEGETPEDTNTEYELQVKYGTEIIDLELPKKLTTIITPEPVTYDTEIDVEWTCETYAPETPGEYVFTAEFTQNGWNYDGEMPTATVTVQADGQVLAMSEPEESQEAAEDEQTASLSPAAEDEETTMAGEQTTSPSPETEEQPTEIPVIEEPHETEISDEETEDDGTIIITSFDQYPYSNPDHPDTHYIVADQGTVQADLSLPKTLKATTEGGEQNAHTVNVSGWECEGMVGKTGTLAEGAYDSNLPGTYRFSPILDLVENEILADGVTTPTVDVVVNSETTMFAAGDMGVMTIYGGNCGTAPNVSNVNWTFNTDTGVLEISGTGSMADFGAEPPWHEYRDGNGNVHQFCSLVKEVVIGNGVMHIGDFAFKSQSNLTKVTIPSSVESVHASQAKRVDQRTIALI